MRHELGAAADAESPVEHRDVLMHGCGAQSESRGNLLLASSFEQKRERLSKTARELSGERLAAADEGTPDQRADLALEEVEQLAFALREVARAKRAMQGDHADLSAAPEAVKALSEQLEALIAGLNEFLQTRA